MSPTVWIHTPHLPGTPHGNATSVSRLGDYMETQGWTVEYFPPGPLPSEGRPHLLHAFHAFKTGFDSLKWGQKRDVPVGLTLTGTDVNSDPPPSLPSGFSWITTLGRRAWGRARELWPHYRDLIHLIPPAPSPLPEPTPFRKTFGYSPDEFVALVLAGLRPVKGVLKTLKVVEPVAQRHPQFRVFLAGEKIDPEYSRQVG